MAVVTDDAMTTVPEDITPDGLAELASSLDQPPLPRIPMELARPAPDDDDGGPPGGILPAQLAVLSPKVPDTLILTRR